MQQQFEPPDGMQLAGHQFVGRGPDGGTGGWTRANRLIYRCAKCGTLMPAEHGDDFQCACGAMLLDGDAGRFGSRYGDENILVYRRVADGW